MFFYKNNILQQPGIKYYFSDIQFVAESIQKLLFKICYDIGFRLHGYMCQGPIKNKVSC